MNCLISYRTRRLCQTVTRAKPRRGNKRTCNDFVFSINYWCLPHLAWVRLIKCGQDLLSVLKQIGCRKNLTCNN